MMKKNSIDMPALLSNMLTKGTSTNGFSISRTISTVFQKVR